MEQVLAWQAAALAWLGSLSETVTALGLSWHGLHAGFAAVVFLALASGVAIFTRRRRDLFFGPNLAIGWGFALLLGVTGGLIIAAMVAPAGTQAWLRGSQLIAAPLTLVLMGLFLWRLGTLEDSDDSRARETELQTELDQARQHLLYLRRDNAELTEQRDRAAREAQNLTIERDSAVLRERKQRIRNERTGLYSRAHFIERLREEFERCQRRGDHPLPLFIGFPGLEKLDAQQQTTVLEKAGYTVKSALRLPDLACQFSDTELLVIPCDTDRSGVGALSRRLHRNLKRNLARAAGNRQPAPACVFVLLEFSVNLQQFEDYLEACDASVKQVRHQPANRLTRLPASFAADG